VRPVEQIPPGLTRLHWVVLGLVSRSEISPPEQLASEIGIDVADIESICQDLEELGWIQRVGMH